MKEVKVPVSFDFSWSGINYMLELARKENLGKPLKLEMNDEQDKWWLLCEDGKVISDYI